MSRIRWIINKWRSVQHINKNHAVYQKRYVSYGSRKEESFSKKYVKCLINGAAASILCVAYGISYKHGTEWSKSSSSTDSDVSTAGKNRPDLPYFSMEEISRHCSRETGIWVTFNQGVYDITNFVDEHPGGDQILLAAGSSIEPFWLLYGAHKTDHVLNLLEKMRIGNVSLDETRHFVQDIVDPYANDPRRHGILKVHSEKPYNAEPPAELLVESFYTPNEIFYVRNHLPVPEVKAETYELIVEVEGVDKSFTFSLDDLKKFPKRTINATIMCAGNRRSEMAEHKQVKGLDWGAGAIGTASWGGVSLKDILKSVGINEDTNFQHVQFEGLDMDGSGNPYGASIPIWKAVDRRGDVILAYEMNGNTLPRDHGFPIRVIVPGVVGARNVKWLGKIIISKEESKSHWQQNDYKGFSPSVDWDNVDFTKSPAIQELPVVSAICKPRRNETVQVVDGNIKVKGYAWSGGGQKVVRVDVTTDGGDTWHVATFDVQDNQDPPRHWSWTLWSIEVPVDVSKGKVEIWAKAVDSSYNTQPETFKTIWNLRGVLSNAYHRIQIFLTDCQ